MNVFNNFLNFHLPFAFIVLMYTGFLNLGIVVSLETVAIVHLVGWFSSPERIVLS